MNNNRGKTKTRRDGSPSLLNRATSLLLAMLLLFASTGMPVQAGDEGDGTLGPVEVTSITGLDMKFSLGDEADYQNIQLKNDDDMPVDATLSITLQIGDLDVEAGQTLTYQIPSDTLDTVDTGSGELVNQSTVIGTYSIDANRLVTITLDDSIFSTDEETGETEPAHITGATFTFTGGLMDTKEPGAYTFRFGDQALKVNVMSTESYIAAKTKTDETEAQEQTEEQTSGSQKKAAARVAADDNTIDLADYLDDATMLISVEDATGKTVQLTPAEIKDKGLEVTKGTGVKVELTFNTISGIKAGQKLVYQLPEKLMNYSGSPVKGNYLWADVVRDSSTGDDAAEWGVDANGTITVTLLDEYFQEHQVDGAITLHGLYIKFSGNLSEERGEHSGNDDDVITFRGETEGDFTFKIPFEYRNENANVEVTKELVNYDAQNRIASYKIVVTAPDTNTLTATNVKVTDVLNCNSSCLKTDNNKNIYQSSVPSTGANTFDSINGVWTIGDMKPGQEETLTYDLKFDDTAFTSGLDAIVNTATVTFNKDGKAEATATKSIPTVSLTKTTDTKAMGQWAKQLQLHVDKDGNTYAAYTLTVKASSAANNIKVVDEFSDPTLITDIVAETPSAGFANVQDKVLTWTIDSMTAGTTATLTYRAYLDTSKWASTTENVQLYVTNNAKLYVDNSPSEIPIPDDATTVSYPAKKEWVKKDGEKVLDGSKKDLLKYVVEVNGDPVSGNIKTIYDHLSNGTYEAGGDLVIDYYTSSDKSSKVDTKTVKLSEIVTDYGATGEQWTIDLTNVNGDNISGQYFYVITYYVSSMAVNVVNEAGIGFGDGTGISATATIEGGGGLTYNSDYNKSAGTKNLKEGYQIWTTSIWNTIPEGSIYVDRLSEPYVYRYQQFWFDAASLAEIVVKFGDETLKAGEDYTVEGKRESNSFASITDPQELRYNRFEVTFNNEYAATKDKKVTIQYKIILNTEPQSSIAISDGYKAGGQSSLYYNYCYWLIPQDGNYIPMAQDANYYEHSYNYWNYPLTKSNGAYKVETDAETGENSANVTWTLTVNQNTTIAGDVVLEEYLPVGLTVADVTKDITLSKTNDTVSANTALGNITLGTYEDDNGNTAVKVSIPIKNLVAFVDSSGQATTGWSDAGKVTITLKTKVDDAWYMNLGSATTLTNTAVLTGDQLKNDITETGTVTIPKPELLVKSQATTQAPAYVQYALNVNSNAITFANTDVLEIVDIMNTGMSLATAHTDSAKVSDSFKVYDLTGVTNAVDSDGTIIVANVSNGKNEITDQCTIEDITGEKLDGMTDDEVGKPAYKITVPNGTHVAIVYWAAFEGYEGEEVDVSNKASFFYNAMLCSSGGGGTNKSAWVQAADSGVYAGKFFTLAKTDQFGDPISGAGFKLYQVTLDADGNEVSRQQLGQEMFTGDDGYLGFGSTGSNGIPELASNTLYCVVETTIPEGYSGDDEPYYFVFATKDCTVEAPTEKTLHKLASGGTYSFINEIKTLGYRVPVAKTINGKTSTSDTVFSFTMTKKDGNAVYTDGGLTKAFPAAGLKTTIKGSGEAEFAEVYFGAAGTYTFTLAEDDLTAEAVAKNFKKDTRTFEVKITVEDKETGMEVTSATFTCSDKTTGDLMQKDVPTFNNTSEMKGTITLNAKKVVSNRTAPVAEGEFAFIVKTGGETIKDENGNEKLFYTKEGGDIEITLDINQNDVGKKRYVICEVQGTDTSIKYSTSTVIAEVTIAEDGNGGVMATNYKYLTGTTFTNTYKASGSLNLTGTKILKNTSGTNVQVYAKEFNFIVTENGKQVATGTTKKGGEIEFTPINYVASDIGSTHTYTITEVAGDDVFVEYTDKTHTVVVSVTDAGEGNLTAKVTSVDGVSVLNDTDAKTAISFTNIYNLVVPTGIRVEIIPYVLALALPVCFGAAVLLRNRKRARARRR
jgi:pilin isopeptide linkage protein